MNTKIRVFANLIFLLEGLSLGLAFYKSIYLIETIQESYFKTKIMPESITMLFFSIVASLLLVFYLRGKLKKIYESESLPYPEISFESSFLPMLLAAPLFFIPCGIYTPLLFILSVSISIFRYISLIPKSFQINFNIKFPLFYLFLFFLLLVIYETLIQQRALDSFILNYSDWGIYTNVVDNTLKGNFFYSNELGRNYLGHHFMPGAFLIMMPFIALFRSPTSIFVLNSIVIYVGAFIIYALALKKDIPKSYAIMLAMIYCIAPSLSHMVISLFYGFHPVYIAMPLIGLFFLFYERKNFIIAFTIFIFSLTIKETTAIFWIGTGGMIFIMGNKKTGSFIIGMSIIYFLLTTLLVMPAISGKENYEFVARFNHLGNSFSEIALSPFTKPSCFIGTLLRPQNIFYISIILLPVFMLSFNCPLVLGGSLIMLFSMLQASDQMCHLGTQYQSEALMLLYISSVYGFSRCLNGAGRSLLLRFFLTGIKDKVFSANLPAALMISVLFSALTAFYFFGKNYFTKNSDILNWAAPRYNNEIESIKRFLPAGASLTTTPRLGANFLFRNDVFLDYNRPLKDFVLICLDDQFSHAQNIENLREEVICSGKYKLLKDFIIGNSIVLLYGKTAPGEHYISSKPGIIHISLADWLASERSFAFRIPEIEYKVFWGLAPSGKNEKRLNLIFRIMKKIDFDIDIEIYEVQNSKEKKFIDQYSFGNGVFPAYLAEEGDAYIIDQILPEDITGEIAIMINTKPKPANRHYEKTTGNIPENGVSNKCAKREDN